METILSHFVELITLYQLPVTFLGAFFFGESVIVTAAYMAADFDWNIWAISLAAFCGTVAADSMWFFVGKLARDAMPKRWEKHRESAEELVESLTGKKPFVALLFIKFLYGSRIAMILYLASKRVPFYLFTIYNSIGTIIWLLVMIPLGYFASVGLGRPESVATALQVAVAVFVGSMILFRLLSLWLTKTIEKK
jgi:membrane protein DedA with SNARE-associated domain